MGRNGGVSIKFKSWDIEWSSPTVWFKIFTTSLILIAGYVILILVAAIFTKEILVAAEYREKTLFGIQSVLFGSIFAYLFNVASGIGRDIFEKFNQLFDDFGIVDMLFFLIWFGAISVSIIFLSNMFAKILSLEGIWQTVAALPSITLIICFPGVIKFLTRTNPK